MNPMSKQDPLRRGRVESDKLLRCQECGTEFLFTAWEQRRWRAEQGAELPASCPGCRALARLLAPTASAPEWEEGVVRWYDARKGFGFLAGADGERVFFHRASLGGTGRPRRGQRVRFQRRQSDRGSEALRVRVMRGGRRDPVDKDTSTSLEAS